MKGFAFDQIFNLFKKYQQPLKILNDCSFYTVTLSLLLADTNTSAYSVASGVIPLVTKFTV